MAYYIWHSPAARRAIAAMSDDDTGRYEEIEAFLADFPNPIKGSALSAPATWHGLDGYMLRLPDFQYLIFYSVNDDAQDLTIHVVMRAGG